MFGSRSNQLSSSSLVVVLLVILITAPSIVVVVVVGEPFNKELTIFVDPGRMECYYQAITETEKIHIEYQVIHGGHGEAHINFRLMDPNRGVLVTGVKQSDGHVEMIANHTGVYEVCFDNTISTFNQKIVFFRFDVIPSDREWLEREKLRKEMLTDYQFDKVFTDLHEYLNQININMMRSRELQRFIRSNEARDRNLAEMNYSMVQKYSWVQFIAMIVVGLLQVIMLRSIFYTDGRLHKIWRRI